MTPLVLLSAFACDMGPSAETLVDELRVLSVLAEPPEARPGELVELESLVVDPEERGYEVATWTCTPLGDAGCAEAAGLTGGVWDGLAVDAADETAWFPSSYLVAPQLADFVSATPIPLAQHWTLACEPGLCEALDLAGDAPEPGSRDAEALQELLSDPFSFMEGLPKQGVSLALRSVSVSTRDDAERVQNPTVECRPAGGEVGDPLTVEPRGRLPLDCAVAGRFDGDGAIWGYATAGGFEGDNQEVDDGDVDKRYPWIAPKAEDVDGPVFLWVVVSDGFGGVGIWEGSVEVVE